MRAKLPLLMMGYAALAALGSLLYSGNSEVAYFWPANALVVAVLVRSLTREWPLLLAAVVPTEAGVDLYYGLPLLTGLSLGVANALEAGIAAWLLRRSFARQSSELESLGNLFRFIGVCVFAPTVSAFVGATVLVQSGMAQNYWMAWRLWWLGDALGLLVTTPPLLALVSGRYKLITKFRPALVLEWLAMLLGVALASFVAFGTFGQMPALHSLVFPLLVWAALRFGVDGAAWALLEVVGIAVWCDMRGHGAFVPPGSGAAAHALAVQAFLSMAAIATLVLAAVLAERHWAMQRFRRLVEATPNGIVMVDAADRLTFANARAQSMFGYAREELVGQQVGILIPPASRNAYETMRSEFLGNPVEAPIGAGHDLVLQRKDGSLISVEIGVKPVRTQEGPMVLAALLDVSERKHAEERLRAAYLEKEVLLKEVYHRVKNNLQIVSALISLQSRHVSEKSAREALARGEARIHSMALVHEQLYRSDNLSTLDIGSYLSTLVGYLRTQFNEPLRIHVECDAVHLGMDQAIPCGLIVTELVTNASRHAFVDGRRGEVVVSLRRDGDAALLLEVRDNGVGLPEGVEDIQQNSLGWVLINSLAKQIGATVTVLREHGTAVQLRCVENTNLDRQAA